MNLKTKQYEVPTRNSFICKLPTQRVAEHMVKRKLSIKFIL